MMMIRFHATTGTRERSHILVSLHDTVMFYPYIKRAGKREPL